MSTSKPSKKYPVEPTVSGRKVSSLEHDLTAFLGALCIEWGFCIPPLEAERIAKIDEITADEFATEVLEAEGLNSHSPWFAKISKRFAKRFGYSVNASTYHLH